MPAVRPGVPARGVRRQDRARRRPLPAVRPGSAKGQDFHLPAPEDELDSPGLRNVRGEVRETEGDGERAGAESTKREERAIKAESTIQVTTLYEGADMDNQIGFNCPRCGMFLHRSVRLEDHVCPPVPEVGKRYHFERSDVDFECSFTATFVGWEDDEPRRDSAYLLFDNGVKVGPWWGIRYCFSEAES